MSSKAKKVLKFILTIGIVLSAVAAVFAIIVKMQKKLCAVDEEENDGEVCNGSCSDCGICASAEDAEEAEADDEEQ